ncbi:hypothetical protein [Rhizorhapis sp.]|uniref:hypothetical protein n=1 Tax=Rhizorhapis sp. TaxID=1968842 RepID=UPI002B48CD03|nr:hypothetical protein [Rhizorhapis sp.]HKR17586.1 hypothetical protein [Rhizorhapis sp.]
MRIKSAFHMLALFLAGCAGGASGDYPSLARRPIESQGSEIASPTPTEVQEDPVLAKQVEGLVEKARAGAAAFDAGLPKARQQVDAAAGSAVSSEAWVTAELAISTLESNRYDSVFALASLDTLYVSRMNAIAAGEAKTGGDVVDRARADVVAIVDRQNDTLDALRNRLATP